MRGAQNHTTTPNATCSMWNPISAISLAWVLLPLRISAPAAAC